MPEVRRSPRLQALKAVTKPKENLKADDPSESHREILGERTTPPVVADQIELLSEPGIALIEAKEEPRSVKSEGPEFDHINKVLEMLRSLQENIRKLKS